MKKVAICINTLNVGGVANSLVNFIKNLQDDINIDLILFQKDGDLITSLDKQIKVIYPTGYMDMFLPGFPSLKKFGLKKFILKFFMGISQKLFRKNKCFVKFACKHSQKLSGYDVAIAFNGVAPNGSPWVGAAEYVLNNIDAKKKFAITHDDYMAENYKNHSIKLYQQFDKIFAVSKSCQKRIEQNVPQLKWKLDYLYNFCNESSLKQKLKDKVMLDSTFNITTVARLSKEKGVIRGIKAVKKLIEDGYNFKYNIIGDGVQRKELEDYVKKNNLDNVVTFYGYQKNPLSFVSSSNLFLLPSFREAAPMVFAESFITGTPVLSTETVSAKELIGQYGFVCENSEDGIYDFLRNLLKNKELILEKKEKLKQYKYNNEEIKSKILKIIEE